MSSISKRILELINERGVNPNQLANALDLTAASVYKWFSPKNPTMPSLENLLKFLDVYNISAYQFISNFDLPQLSEDEKKVLRKWSVLSPEDKAIFYALLDRFASEKAL